MPRPRGFDEDEVLHRALQLFWSRGYDGATLEVGRSANKRQTG